MAEYPKCENESEVPDYKLFPHRGFNLISTIHSPEKVDRIQDLEIDDSDVFVITYPKSGTIWMQQILSMIQAKGDITVTEGQLTSDRFPWIEVYKCEEQFCAARPPRIYVSHLPYHLVPRALRQNRGKVIYVARNPKDILVSYFHFHKYAVMLETPKDFDEFFEKFMQGKVFGGSWFDHIKTWYWHRDKMNFLFVTYEEMIQDLRSVVEKICLFLERDLSTAQLDSVVTHSTFGNMRKNPWANYEKVSDHLLNKKHGMFLRKGTVGDWKNYFSVAQNDRFDSVFQEQMRDIPLRFLWDI